MTFGLPALTTLKNTGSEQVLQTHLSGSVESVEVGFLTGRFITSAYICGVILEVNISGEEQCGVLVWSEYIPHVDGESFLYSSKVLIKNQPTGRVCI